MKPAKAVAKTVESLAGILAVDGLSFAVRIVAFQPEHKTVRTGTEG
jgi:hypothetical protein